MYKKESTIIIYLLFQLITLAFSGNTYYKNSSFYWPGETVAITTREA